MPSDIVPPARPEIEREFVLTLIHEAGTSLDKHKVLLVGRRGYYRDSMGEPGKNDRGLYDDAIVLISPTAFVAFNANTDPSKGQYGMASLVGGVWRLKFGIHNRTKPKSKQYPALIQDAEFVVRRDGTESTAKGLNHPRFGRSLGQGYWVGWFGINLHRGGYTTTGSAGCQTIYPTQWDAFLSLCQMEADRYNLEHLYYVLSVRPDV